MTHPDPLKNLWTSNGDSIEPMTPGELNKLAKTFRGKIARRNILEYIAAMIVIAFFAAFYVIIPGTLSRLGSVMMILGTIYVMWSLYNRAGSAAKSETDAAESIMSFHRNQLERQRDALKSVLTWYILPLLPGAFLFIIGTTPELFTESRRVSGLLEVLRRAGVLTLICLVIWGINKRAAKKLDDEIKSLQLSKL